MLNPTLTAHYLMTVHSSPKQAIKETYTKPSIQTIQMFGLQLKNPNNIWLQIPRRIWKFYSWDEITTKPAEWFDRVGWQQSHHLDIFFFLECFQKYKEIFIEPVLHDFFELRILFLPCIELFLLSMIPGRWLCIY